MSAQRGLGVGLLLVWAALALPGLGVDRLSLIAWGILVVAALAIPIARARSLLMEPSSRSFLIATALGAALISYLLISGPMRDRPVSIDARVYLLQARALSHGHLGMPIPEPRQLFGGRFLFEGPDGHLYGVFPPGFPLFLAPFVALGVPLLAGPVIAAALVGAQGLLGHAIEGEDGFATRLSIVLSLPSLARAVETADLLSHAFVAVLATTAIALAIRARSGPTVRRLLLIGALLGWATLARLLDGLVISAIVAVILLPARQRMILPLLTFLPFLTILLFAQKAATGSFAVPTQTLYFARSDWPPTCHRLGFGVDVGCNVEHGDERARFGADGYTAGDVFRVVRERASVLGQDLFGFAPIALLSFVRLCRRGERRDLFLAGTIVLFTLAYGLFYYGNAPIFGARHLFPVAALFWLLCARSVSDPLPRLPGLPLAIVIAGAFAAAPRWIWTVATVRAEAHKRVDVRAVLDRADPGRGFVVTDDELSWIAGFDPYRDGSDRVVVRFDRSGLLDARRTHPDWPVHNIVEGDQLLTAQLAAPRPGLLFELERAWPSFVRPNGVGTRVVYSKKCCQVESSGERVLFFLAAHEGATLTIPFTTARAQTLALRVDGLVAPDYGTWAVAVDAHPLPAWDGYSAKVSMKRGEATAPVEVAAGAHILTFRCTGKHRESSGYLAGFDALIGAP